MSENRKKEFDKYNLIDKDKWNIIKNEIGNRSKEDLDKKWFGYLKIVLLYKEKNKKVPPQSDIENKGQWLSDI